MTKLCGVNLGGWLVLEKWLTPGLFAAMDAVDEHTFMQRDGANKKIEHHRRKFITEDDFKWLHEHKIDVVRIPVGYWLFEPVDGFTPTVDYLDQAMKWAEKYDLQVLIDLHAAKGSQNGFDNSGIVGTIGWYNDQYQTETIELLCRIAERYKTSPALWGIELLNEPLSKGHYWSLLRFYRQAYRALCDILPPGVHIVFHDSFRPLLFAGALRQRKSHPVLMDVHWYAIPAAKLSVHKYLDRSARLRTLLLGYLQLWQPVIVGEWSTVLPQHFFDALPTGQHMELLSKSAQIQLRVYKNAAGWVYFNYKAEGGGMWNFRDLAEKGIIDIK